MALGLCLLRSLTASSLSWSCPWKCLVCENKQSNSAEDLCAADVKVAAGGRDCWASATVGYLSFCLSNIFFSALPVSRNQSVVLLSLSVCLLIIFRLLHDAELFNVCIPSLTSYFFLSLTLSNFFSPYLILLLLGNFLINLPAKLFPPSLQSHLNMHRCLNVRRPQRRTVFHQSLAAAKTQDEMNVNISGNLFGRPLCVSVS